MLRIWLIVVLGLFAGFQQAMATESSEDEILLTKLMSDSQQKEAATLRGEERSRLCSYCHGETGTSKRDYIPNLAGQDPAYLIKQFEGFKSGSRRSYVMKQVADGLSSQEKVDLALYYSAQKPKSIFAVEGAVDNGKGIYDSSCRACHGDAGQGQQDVPRIAEQPQVYLIKTLTAVANGEHSRSIPQMQPVVAKLSAQQIQDVTAWLASAR